ncbi:MAG: hypothetical protein LBE38_02135 [Deltaproteobacteria bacterium]|jgi:hypothetical protein|nr:hypothetical protein [Deltaproteobacteria bacterium]
MENISDLTITYEEDGQVLMEELDKIVIQKGVWAVILYRYREMNQKLGDFGPPKACLRRYQKTKGIYKKRDSVNLSKDSAITLRDQLDNWLQEGLLGE